ncbi:MAG: hypothetical protein AB7G25_04860 [Sphingomonadaceae bacterium]
MSLTLITIGSGLGFRYFYDIGVISALLFTAIMIFIGATAVGIIIGLDIERQARRKADKRPNEVPPPFDLYSVWPLTAETSDGVPRKDATEDSNKQGFAKREP